MTTNCGPKIVKKNFLYVGSKLVTCCENKKKCLILIYCMFWPSFLTLNYKIGKHTHTQNNAYQTKNCWTNNNYYAHQKVPKKKLYSFFLLAISLSFPDRKNIGDLRIAPTKQNAKLFFSVFTNSKFPWVLPVIWRWIYRPASYFLLYLNFSSFH